MKVMQNRDQEPRVCPTKTQPSWMLTRLGGPLISPLNAPSIFPSDIQALLLSDCLVLLQRGPDDRLLLRNPSRWLGGGGGVSGDSKTSLSPVVKLDSLLVRPVATSTAGRLHARTHSPCVWFSMKRWLTFENLCAACRQQRPLCHQPH